MEVDLISLFNRDSSYCCSAS